ncbi:MAG: dTDP-4-dehydrorhamnose 3,5-epimerase [Deltaproteobacteria bacterium]|nr:dTDP-4-dehydrorhamnose 3,5-epimerase [Deltaproteobacteria bacterium]MBW2663209.1 dTDP-4-dehydrorhamnose 3,5-epimerase [Deltaproteobacteria bacterium]
MKIKPIPLQDAFVIEPEPFMDDRGVFARVFCQNELRNILHDKNIVQINHSITRQKGAIRGMHFQRPPKVEIKMVKCLCGSVFDVIIDLRKASSTFLKWHGEKLSAENMKMMYVPEGFAHGFQALEENTELLYLHTEFYSPENEGALRYDDPKIGIKWSLEVADISERDKNHPLLAEDFQGIEIKLAAERR